MMNSMRKRKSEQSQMKKMKKKGHSLLEELNQLLMKNRGEGIWVVREEYRTSSIQWDHCSLFDSSWSWCIDLGIDHDTCLQHNRMVWNEREESAPFRFEIEDLKFEFEWKEKEMIECVKDCEREIDCVWEREGKDWNAWDVRCPTENWLSQ